MRNKISSTSEGAEERYTVSFSTADVASSVVGLRIEATAGPMTESKLRRYLCRVDGLSDEQVQEELGLLKLAGGGTPSIAEGSPEKVDRAREFAKQEDVPLREERVSSGHGFSRAAG